MKTWLAFLLLLLILLGAFAGCAALMPDREPVQPTNDVGIPENCPYAGPGGC